METQVNIDELKALQAAKDWSLSVMASEIGVNKGYLSRVLNGHKPGGGKLILGILALCQREGIDPDRFILLPTTATTTATVKAS